MEWRCIDYYFSSNPQVISKSNLRGSKVLEHVNHDSWNARIVWFGTPSPLPQNATWGNTQILTTKNELLPEFSYKGSCISTVFCVDIQHVSPCCHDPLGRYWDEAEDKNLNATRFLEPESLGVKLANDGLIEIVYECCQQQEHATFTSSSRTE